MKSIEFLNEAEVTPYEHEVLTIKKAVSYLNEYCKQSRAMVNSPLWRGVRNHSDEVFAAWPETGERKSNNTTNYYTEILSNSPFMRGWPARNKSFICTTNFSYATDYVDYGSANTYAIFPFDQVEIAACPGEDMWDIKVSIPRLKIQNRKIEEINDFFT